MSTKITRPRPKITQKLKNRVFFLLTEKERALGHRIKQSEVAEAVGVAQHTIAGWMKNEVTKFEAHVLIGLCNYFNCKIEDLIYIEGEPNPPAADAQQDAES